MGLAEQAEAAAGYGATIVLVGKSLQESIDHALARLPGDDLHPPF
jgi:hypothetical protein